MPLLRENPRLAAAWAPSWRGTFAVLLAVRIAWAAVAVIGDCDEVYNYWEPLHQLGFGRAFETWEYAPQYAIRSWAYILLHLPVALVGGAHSKRAAFYAVRVFLAAISAAADAALVASVARHVNARVARYMAVLLATCAGPAIAAVALLPSSLAMYATTLGWATAMPRASSAARTFRAALAFAVGALAGWPFALVAAVPFVLEELFLAGGDVRLDAALLARRWARGLAAALAALALAVPLCATDSLAYGRAALVPLHTVLYNVLGRARAPRQSGGTRRSARPSTISRRQSAPKARRARWPRPTSRGCAAWRRTRRAASQAPRQKTSRSRSRSVRMPLAALPWPPLPRFAHSAHSSPR